MSVRDSSEDCARCKALTQTSPSGINRAPTLGRCLDDLTCESPQLIGFAADESSQGRGRRSFHIVVSATSSDLGVRFGAVFRDRS